MNTLIPKKYLTATLTLAILVGAAFQAALVGGITVVEALQVAALLVGGVVTYYSPLVAGKWPGVLKVAGAVIGAVLVAIISVFDSAANGTPIWNTETVTLIVLAALNALAAQFGVDQRIDATKEAVAAPEVTTAQIDAADPQAANVVANGAG